MKKIITAITVASMLLAAQASVAAATDHGKPVRFLGKAHASQTHATGKRDLGKFAIGLAIGAGLVGAALAAKRSHASDVGYIATSYGDERGMCRIWRADCRYGSERACFKYEQRC